MEITVRKASPATIQMIGENGDSINVTEEVISTIEETTDKTDELITKQSVLDVFNKQFLERLNLVPKYSRNYYYIGTGDPDTIRSQEVHSSFYNSLGGVSTENEYGITCMHDYIRLDQFQDQEGDITFDDLVGTFTQTILYASRLAKYKITIMKGSRKYSEKEVYAALHDGNPNMIDYNTVKNSIVGTTEFNTICKRWYQRVLDHAEEAQQRKEYVYRLPDPPPPAQGGVKYFKKERHSGRVNSSMNNRQNTNTAEFDTIFGEGRAIAYFLLPKVVRNLRGFKLRKQFRIREHGVIISALLIHKDTGVILAEAPDKIVRSNSPEDIFYFTQTRITMSDKPIDDLILRLQVRTSGDRGDAMAVVVEITELIFDDEYDVYPALSRTIPAIDTINSEVQGPEQYYIEYSGIPAYNYRYMVKDFVFKPRYFVYHLEGTQKDRYVFDGIEVYREGRLIGRVGTRLINERNETMSGNDVPQRSAYYWNLNQQEYVTLVTDVSNIDIRNGDTILFKFQFGDRRDYNRNIALNKLNTPHIQFVIDNVYSNHQLIG